VLVETEGVTVSVIEAERTEPAPVRIPMSREEFYNLPEGPPFYEWCRGEAIEMNQPTADHQRALGYIYQILLDVEENSQFEALINLELSMPDSLRAPDVCLVRALKPGTTRTKTPTIIAVEILSPSTRRIDLVDKPTEYAEFGIQQYWIVDLKEPSITIQQNVDGNWITAALLTRDNPRTVVEIPSYGTVLLDLNQILRSKYNTAHQG